MKRLIYVLSVFTLLTACSKEPFGSDQPLPETFVTPLTIDLNASAMARAFDQDMQWVWSNSDVVWLFQNAGACVVSPLLHQGEGVFSGDVIYSTSDPADFYFGMGSSISHSDDNAAHYLTPQHGVNWTPLLRGEVKNTTVSAIESVAMQPLTAALEICTWSYDKAQRAGAISAKLKADKAISGRWNIVTGQVLLEEHEAGISLTEASDRFFFNLPAGVYKAGEVTLHLTIGEAIYMDIPIGGGSGSGSITVVDPKQQKMEFSLPAFELVTGKRTVMHVAMDKSRAVIKNPSMLSSFIGTHLGTATRLKFVANSDQISEVELTGIISGLGAYLLLSDDGTTCEIHTSANEFYIEDDNDDTSTRLLWFTKDDMPNLVSLDFGDHFNTEHLEDFSIDLNKLEYLNFGDSFSTAKLSDVKYLFDGMAALKEVHFGAKFTCDKATSMAYMFRGCTALKQIDISSFDTRVVTDMTSMFAKCSALETLIVGENFSTKAVTNTSSMFENCFAIKSIDEVLRKFDTREVTNMQKMFAYCYALEGADISAFSFVKAPSVATLFCLTGQNAENKPIPITVSQAGYDYLSNATERTYIGYNGQSELKIVSE